MCEVFLGLGYLFLQVSHEVVGFLGVELGDANHADFEEAFDIFSPDFTDEFVFPRREGMVNKLNQFVLVGCCFVSFLFVDALFDEDFLEAGEEELFFQFAFEDLEFPAEQVFGVVNREFEEVADVGEDRVFVADDAAVG